MTIATFVRSTSSWSRANDDCKENYRSKRVIRWEFLGMIGKAVNFWCIEWTEPNFGKLQLDNSYNIETTKMPTCCSGQARPNSSLAPVVWSHDWTSSNSGKIVPASICATQNRQAFQGFQSHLSRTWTQSLRFSRKVNKLGIDSWDNNCVRWDGLEWQRLGLVWCRPRQ